jgi:hypothetical protein
LSTNSSGLLNGSDIFILRVVVKNS